jgi:crotonobetainyl-CoA:carnitine CoA-transferase CaiB-like acyl-CoA transferase
MTEPRSFAPLEGVRVLELTTSIAGPYCGLILATLGADVVKVEPPDRGDDTRAWGPPFWHGESVAFMAMNAGKRSLAIDLKTDAGAQAVVRLASQADVVIQNLRPGLAERLGLSFDDLAPRNDRLVYCSIGAFGSTGPLANEPGYDPLMQAAGGLMSITGEPEGPPVRVGPSIVDQGTGMWCTIGILAALRARDAGAGPQLIDTSLYETAVNWIPYQLAGFLASGVTPRPLGTGIGILAPYQAFRTRDGWVMIAAGNDRLFTELCAALALSWLAHDGRFATNASRVENRDELADLLGARVCEASTDEVLELLRGAGIPVAPIADIEDVATCMQTDALGLLQPVPHPDVPELRLVAPPLSFGGERLRHNAPPPGLGSSSSEVLLEAGFSADEIDRVLA